MDVVAGGKGEELPQLFKVEGLKKGAFTKNPRYFWV